MRGHVDAPRSASPLAPVAVACCAGPPAVSAQLGGITIAAALGVAGGALASDAAASASVLLVRARRRRNCGDVPRPRYDR